VSGRPDATIGAEGAETHHPLQFEKLNIKNQSVK
jgi:hypothetical protein